MFLAEGGDEGTGGRKTGTVSALTQVEKTKRPRFLDDQRLSLSVMTYFFLEEIEKKKS